MRRTILWHYQIQTDNLISARWTNLLIIKKTNKTCRIEDFAVLADHGVKLKESKKTNKYLDLAWELKNMWNMKVTVIPIGIGAFDTEELVQGLEDLEITELRETSQTKALLRPAIILGKVLETYCHSNFSESPSAKANVKNSQGVK